MASQHIALLRGIRTLLQAVPLQDTAAAAPTYAIAFEPAEPDFTVTLIPETGPAPQHTLGDFPNFTIRVRHSDPEQANDVASAAFGALQEFGGRPNSVPVARITANTGAVQLGYDDSQGRKRWRVSQTYTAIVRQP